jgi:DNA-binding MarR family transcriptional regulator
MPKKKASTSAPGDYEGIELWGALMQGQASVAHAVDRQLESELGITLAWHEVLERLAAAPEGRLRMQELAELMLITKSGLTRLCDRIEAAGYITRASCPTDRRGTFAVITPEGRAMAERARPIFLRAAEDRFFRHLSEKERASLKSVLLKVIGANGGHLCWSPSDDAEKEARTSH